jgi:hydrogenase maturation protein HypF
VAVQHHHAHLAAALAAAGRDEESIGLALDGTGWGPDATVWGGELIVGSAAGMERVGRLRHLPLPGGEGAIRRPLRMAVAALHVLVPGSERLPLALFGRAAPGEAETVWRMVDRRFNSPPTSSAGRLFDAVSSLLGVRDDATYEGQAAIELEQVARLGDPAAASGLACRVTSESGSVIIDPEPMIRGLVDALLAGADVADLAAGFHEALALALAEACRLIASAGGPGLVAPCGGVFQNRILAGRVSELLETDGFEVLRPGEIPVNDAAVALGQAVVAAHR